LSPLEIEWIPRGRIRDEPDLWKVRTGTVWVKTGGTVWVKTLVHYGVQIDRVKESLHQAKLRGVRLGSPKCYLTDTDRKKGSKIGAEVRTEKARAKAKDIMEIVDDIMQCGIISLKGIARELTKRGVPTPRGKANWYPATVKRLYERVS